jgi:hypothetical protein
MCIRDSSCTGNQYCESTCTSNVCDATQYNASVQCWSGSSAPRTACGQSFPTYLARCCTQPTGATGKQCTACYNVANYCGVGQDGWYDDCNGTGCGYCPGTNPAATPIPTAAGGGSGSGSGSLCSCADYASQVAATCSNANFYCPTSNPASYCYGTKACVAPTFNSLTILNSKLSALTADSNGRNNICETAIAADSNPRIVLFRVVATDLDGYGDIVTVEMRRNGVVTALDFVSGSGNDATYIKSIDYTGVNETQTYPVEIRVTDSNGQSTGWVNSGRSFKVWNCQVAVSGSLYDSSAGSLACNTSFTNLIDAALGFTSLSFSNLGGKADVSASVSTNSFSGANLQWGENYIPYFNGGNSIYPNGTLPVSSGRITRITDSETSTISCPLINQYSIKIGDYVSAYSTAPTAKIDFSFIRKQEAWFQVIGAGVKAKFSVDSGVPSTVNTALSISGIRSGNALVSFTSSSNINGNSGALYGSPNNWWIDKNTNDSVTYNYQGFYNSFFVNGGVGTTNASWGAISPDGGIYFVNGDLNINNDFYLNVGKYIMVIVKGKITIDPSVNRIDGIYMSDGGIEALGSSTHQLLINGMLYSKGDIRLARSFTDKIFNNDGPAIVINYQPDLIFNLPGKLMRVLSGWREE